MAQQPFQTAANQLTLTLQRDNLFAQSPVRCFRLLARTARVSEFPKQGITFLTERIDKFNRAEDTLLYLRERVLFRVGTMESGLIFDIGFGHGL
jgi:hypothetical protein